MRIAIIGTGVSGLTAAHLLNPHHDVKVYEAANYIGGHVNTIDVEERKQSLSIDTGFIVFNDWTYPNFENLIDKLDVDIDDSEMSFSARCENTGFEWSGSSLSTLIFNNQNWKLSKPYLILFDVLRFNKTAKRFLQQSSEELSLEEFLKKYGFSNAFTQYYILPMGAAIWSSCTNQIKHYPARSFLKFFYNHGLLNIKNRPQWKTIRGGSKRYVSELIKPFRHKIFLGSKVEKVTRNENNIIVHAHDHEPSHFDHIIFACHSDQALKILENPTSKELSILSNLKFQHNTAVLHTDPKFMPKRKELWSSWNYWVPQSESKTVKVTYYMNRLQNLSSDRNYFVTLNSNDIIDPEKVLYSVNYSHPVFDISAIESQRQFSDINGIKNTWYCGAYWRNGFHEDGVWSAIQSVNLLNNRINCGQLHLQRAS